MLLNCWQRRAKRRQQRRSHCKRWFWYCIGEGERQTIKGEKISTKVRETREEQETSIKGCKVWHGRTEKVQEIQHSPVKCGRCSRLCADAKVKDILIILHIILLAINLVFSSFGILIYQPTCYLFFPPKFSSRYRFTGKDNGWALGIPTEEWGVCTSAYKGGGDYITTRCKWYH